jgi:hypothetical protein
MRKRLKPVVAFGPLPDELVPENDDFEHLIAFARSPPNRRELPVKHQLKYVLRISRIVSVFRRCALAYQNGIPDHQPMPRSGNHFLKPLRPPGRFDSHVSRLPKPFE